MRKIILLSISVFCYNLLFGISAYASIVNIPTGHNYSTGGVLVGSKLYLPTTDSENGIDVINTTTNTLIKTIEEGGSYYSSGILIGTKFYIGTYGSDGINIYDTTTDTFLSYISTGNGYFNAGYFDNNKLYLPALYSNYIDIVDTTSDTLAPASPITTSGSYYSSSAENGYVFGTNGVDIIDSSTDTVTQVATGHSGYSSVTTVGYKLYVPTYGYGVDIIDTADSNNITNMSHIDNTYQGSATLVGSKLYIPVENSSNGGGVDVYDTLTDSFEENISTGGTYTSTGVLVGDNLYIPRSTGGVDIINTADNNTVTNIPTGRTYYNLKITQVGEKLFIPSSSGGNGVDVILPDPVTPNAPSSAPDLISSSDTGSSDTDNNTTDTTPTFDIVCTEAGNTIKLYSDQPSSNTLIASHICTGSGTEEVTVSSALSEATHSITYTESNDGGESGESPSLSIIIDATAPSSLSVVSIGGDTSSPYSTTDATPDIIISTEVDDTVTISGFSCSPTPATGSSVTCTKDSPDYTVGSHSVSPTVTDTAGNSTSGSVSFNITVPPPPPPASPDTPSSPPDLISSSDTGSSDTDNNTTDTTPTFDIACTEAGNTIKLYSDQPSSNTLIATHTCIGSGTEEVTVSSALSEATHSITYTESNDGGESGHSDALSVVISIPVSSPSTPTVTHSYGSSRASNLNLQLLVFPQTNNLPSNTEEPKDSICERYLQSYIAFGQNNNPEDVKKLESFLNQSEGENLVVDGVYGTEDVLAVRRFQTKYADQILSPWGLSNSTGNVFRTTTAKINLMMCAKKTTCPYFSKYLKPGDYDSEVVKVQDFLNILSNPTTNSSTSNIPLSPYFNPATVQAVRNYQTIYKKTVLDPWGLQTATGFWYQTTRYASNKLMNCKEGEITLPNGVKIGE